MLLIAAVSITATSCGGGGGGSSNGNLCEQCGDSDGPCNAAGADIPAGARQPSFCPNGADGWCHAALVCTRKVDSAQRRCFPADPATQALDMRFECDGSRPAGTPAATPTPTPTSTPTATGTAATPTATGPTASVAEPSPTPTPAPEEIAVTIDVSTEADGFTADFTVIVTYPPQKGSFGGSAVACEGDSVDPQATDDGNGTLTLRFQGDPDGLVTDGATCTFSQLAGEELVDGDLAASSPTPGLEVEVSF
ncbi:MAG: hypothetical protein B6D46_11635 [Polyangiaceae bacterium UTPRO1]|nr:hypothetical protein [Myxococcales bacterium]OQY66121.1 MAG: hypothetical protein B6D46_11635 [Polyangiaceae bacterium UTPRO1]